MASRSVPPNRSLDITVTYAPTRPGEANGELQLRSDDITAGPDGVVTVDGTHHEADVICYATGFRNNDYLWPMHIVGRNGIVLRDQWGEEPTAYLGITVPSDRAILADIASKHPELVRLIDLNRYLAPRGTYQSWHGTIAKARYDGVHFTPEPAALLTSDPLNGEAVLLSPRVLVDGKVFWEPPALTLGKVESVSLPVEGAQMQMFLIYLALPQVAINLRAQFPGIPIIRRRRR